MERDLPFNMRKTSQFYLKQRLQQSVPLELRNTKYLKLRDPYILSSHTSELNEKKLEALQCPNLKPNSQYFFNGQTWEPCPKNKPAQSDVATYGEQ